MGGEGEITKNSTYDMHVSGKGGLDGGWASVVGGNSLSCSHVPRTCLLGKGEGPPESQLPLTALGGEIKLRSVPMMVASGFSVAYSMAQMPVPVAMSKMRDGDAIGAQMRRSSNISLHMAC